MIRAIIYCILLTLSYQLMGQNVPGSPYSYFGIGDIYHKGFGQQQLIGGTGIATRSPYSLNNLNPASYSSFGSMSMITELGLNLSATIRSDEDNNGGAMDLEFPHLSMGFRTGSNSGISFGLRKFSNVSYNIIGQSSFSGIEGDYLINYKGSGGLNEVYFGYGREFWNVLSIGAHGSYIFGSLTNTQQIVSTSLGYNLGIEDQNFLSGFNLDVGLQLTIPLKTSKLILGATFDPASGLNEDRDLLITEINSEDLITEDTIVTEYFDDLGYSLPDNYGFGISWNYKDKFSVSGDYTAQLWSQVDLDGDNYTLTNSERYSFGLERLPDFRADNWFGKINYGIGVYQHNSYLIADDEEIISRGVTAGFGFPVNNKAIMRFVYENISRGEEGKLFRDNYSKFTVSISLLDVWFSKIRYN